MTRSQERAALACAVAAARAAGQIMRDNFHSPKKINSATQHDIKLELDVRCQKRIETILRRGFPNVAILGEEGVAGDPRAPWRWVVDPIDGTVNFTYEIPHCCVSIALQVQTQPRSRRREEADHNLASSPKARPDEFYQTIAGVVYDPFCEELWTALRGGPARLNGKSIHVSRHSKLSESIVSIGFAKQT